MNLRFARTLLASFPFLDGLGMSLLSSHLKNVVIIGNGRTWFLYSKWRLLTQHIQEFLQVWPGPFPSFGTMLGPSRKRAWKQIMMCNSQRVSPVSTTPWLERYLLMWLVGHYITRPHSGFVCLHLFQKICLLFAELFQFSDQLSHISMRFSQLLWTYNGQGRVRETDVRVEISISFTSLGSDSLADISVECFSCLQGKSDESGNICSNALLKHWWGLLLPSCPLTTDQKSSNPKQPYTITGLMDWQLWY